MIDIQDGFLDYTLWGSTRSNSSFETNAETLLTEYRSLLVKSDPTKHRVINVAHASLIPNSPLHPTALGFAFQAFAKPHEGELVITKHVNSAFIGTTLEQILRSHFGNTGGKLYIAGLTTDHCVSTTTRMAGNLKVVGQGGEVVFVEDATACFKKDEKSPFEADVVHGVHVESLREFATIARTGDLVKQWTGWVHA